MITSEQISKMSRKEKLDLLNRAKDAYYNTGEELLSDYDYDELEAELGLENKNYVGSKHKGYTVKHSFIMGSLSKVQIKEDKKTGVIDWDQYADDINSYLRKASPNYIEVTPKLDGASFSAEFRNNNGEAELISCATRGDGSYGTDISHWFETVLNSEYWDMIDDACANILDDDQILCIRGEVLVPASDFAAKYADTFTNPRSFVSGRLGLKPSEIKKDMLTGSNIHFVCYDYRLVDSTDNTFTELDWMNPADSTYSILKPYLNHIGELPEEQYCQVYKYNGRLTGDDLQQIYDDYAKFRTEESEYALDGIVFKPEASAREYNDNRERPVDCVAMKFVPVISISEIINIEWNVKKSGEYFPKAIIKPIYLDSKKIEKVSLHNYNYIVVNNCGIGSSVRISLAGDIIPYIYEVIYAAGIDDINLPEDSEVYTEAKSGTIHLMKVFDNDSAKEKNRFLASANALVINNVGPAAASLLWDNLHEHIDNLINIVYLMKDDMYNLIKQTMGTSRSIMNIIQGLKDFRENITLEDIIQSFCFKNCGKRASIVCAKILRGEEYSTANLSQSVYGWALDKNSVEYNLVMDVVDELNIDIESNNSSNNSGSQIPIIMTGSPKPFGYNTKKDFLNAHPEYIETTSWTDCKILFTDDLSSTSGKMKKATKAGIPIKTYE